MRYAYALMFTMLLAGAAVPDLYAQRGRGRTSEETTTTSRRDNDDDNDRVLSSREARGNTSARSGRGNGRTSRDGEVYDSRRNDRSGDWEIWRDRRGDDDDDDDDWEDDDDWDDDDRYERRRNGNGPPFCRDGRGHPTKGWEWCEDKGYGRDRDWDYRDRRRDDDDIWRRDRSLGDIIFGDRSGRGRGRTRDRRYIEGNILDDLLGRRVYGNLDSYRRSRNLGGALTGYWLDDDGRHLEIRAGNVALARLYDTNGDGRVDDVRLRR